MTDQPVPRTGNPLNWRLYILFAAAWVLCATIGIGLTAGMNTRRAATGYASSSEARCIAREGWVANGAGNNARAIELLRTAVKRIPNHASNRLNYGLALLKAGRHQDASQEFE